MLRALAIAVVFLFAPATSRADLPSRGKLSAHELKLWAIACKRQPGSHSIPSRTYADAAQEWANYIAKVRKGEKNAPRPSMSITDLAGKTNMAVLGAGKGFSGRLSEVYSKHLDSGFTRTLTGCHEKHEDRCRQAASAWRNFDSRYNRAVLQVGSECAEADQQQRELEEEKRRKERERLAEHERARVEAQRRADELKRQADERKRREQPVQQDQGAAASSTTGTPASPNPSSAEAGAVTPPAAGTPPSVQPPSPTTGEPVESSTAGSPPSPEAQPTADAEPEDQQREAKKESGKRRRMTPEEWRIYWKEYMARMQRQREARRKAKAETMRIGGLFTIGLLLVGTQYYLSLDDEDAVEMPDTALDDSISPFGFNQWLLSGVAMLPMAMVGLPLSIANRSRLAHLDGEVAKWEKPFEAACLGGNPRACEEYVAFRDSVEDLHRPASERENSSVLLGPGSLWGPSWEMRTSISYASGSAAAEGQGSAGTGTVPLEGTLSGASVESSFRIRVVRATVAYTHRYGDLIREDALSPARVRHTKPLGVHSFSGGIGLQPFSGLFSPYAELRFRYHSMTSDIEIAADPPDGSGGYIENYPEELDTSGLQHTDWSLAFGNSFNLSGLWSSKGPFVGSVVVNVGYERSLSDDPVLGNIWSIGLGYSVSSPFDVAVPTRIPLPAQP